MKEKSGTMVRERVFLMLLLTEYLSEKRVPKIFSFVDVMVDMVKSFRA